MQHERVQKSQDTSKAIGNMWLSKTDYTMIEIKVLEYMIIKCSIKSCTSTIIYVHTVYKYDVFTLDIKGHCLNSNTVTISNVGYRVFFAVHFFFFFFFMKVQVYCIEQKASKVRC